MKMLLSLIVTMEHTTVEMCDAGIQVGTSFIHGLKDAACQIITPTITHEDIDFDLRIIILAQFQRLVASGSSDQ